MNILVLPGDDIGPEITAAALAVLERADAIYSLGLELETREVGVASFQRSGTTLPDSKRRAGAERGRRGARTVRHD